MISYLIKKGFVITSRKGSHATLRKDNNKFTTIPVGNIKLKPGLTLGILGDIGITKKEFVNDYQQGIIK